MSYKCPQCNQIPTSVYHRFWLRRYMTFQCKQCGTELWIHRSYLKRSGAGILGIWFFVTLGSSFLPFAGSIRIGIYLVLLILSIIIFNNFVPLQPTNQKK